MNDLLAALRDAKEGVMNGTVIEYDPDADHCEADLIEKWDGPLGGCRERGGEVGRLTGSASGFA